ncbi:(Trans)glycosidase [Venustampulla echinocandica]|uniref:Probable glucan endo-1,3-beta-glucosidase eglC n=1 Tax=Venustampulla echinocandica TaxID=2656787 RepID=A0A370U1R6_9HELO|nr:(Trans)glycosidase [Venustampulla echinocandica]RDL41705.1 (Trans)glycosidase [Venustampulla echinocandica]
MKVAAYALALAASLSGANAYWSGFNALAKRADGQCKTQADWEQDFRAMKSLPGGFTSLRVYASSDCNTLTNAVPAAIATGGHILVGVWTQDDNHFNAEKQALLAAVQQHGFGWVVAVSVGSEDLYRKETPAWRLAEQIHDVRGMLSTVLGYTTDVQVGHVDTWTAWVDGANTAVIQACDFVGTDGYPYFQNKEPNSIDVASNLFWNSVKKTRDVVNSVKPGTWVWVTETGWPSSGPVENQATPSVDNAQRYWKEVACSAFSSAHTFWYSLQDFNASPSFGVLDVNFNPVYNLAC